MCDLCKENTGVDYEIIGKTSLFICPNCLAINLCNDSLQFPDPLDEKISEISGYLCPIPAFVIRPGNDVEYTLNLFETKRFLGHQLMPDEYHALLLTHDCFEYDLHDDFYTETGLAIQPLLDDYVENLKRYSMIHTY